MSRRPQADLCGPVFTVFSAKAARSLGLSGLPSNRLQTRISPSRHCWVSLLFALTKRFMNPTAWMSVLFSLVQPSRPPVSTCSFWKLLKRFLQKLHLKIPCLALDSFPWGEGGVYAQFPVCGRQPAMKHGLWTRRLEARLPGVGESASVHHTSGCTLERRGGGNRLRSWRVTNLAA